MAYFFNDAFIEVALQIFLLLALLSMMSAYLFEFFDHVVKIWFIQKQIRSATKTK